VIRKQEEEVADEKASENVRLIRGAVGHGKAIVAQLYAGRRHAADIEHDQNQPKQRLSDGDDPERTQRSPPCRLVAQHRSEDGNGKHDRDNLSIELETT